jgi:hypothetical protein
MADLVWGKSWWNALTPAGTNIGVSVRAANLESQLQFQPWTPVSNNADFLQKGRFLQVEARLNASSAGGSPVLNDLSIANSTCDVNGDGKIDRTDIALITAARNKPANTFDNRDADGDGMITINDGRACTLRCTKPACAL